MIRRILGSHCCAPSWKLPRGSPIPEIGFRYGVMALPGREIGIRQQNKTPLNPKRCGARGAPALSQNGLRLISREWGVGLAKKNPIKPRLLSS